MRADDVESDEDDLRPEYDFSTLNGGVRGKYLERYRAGTSRTLLSPQLHPSGPKPAPREDATARFEMYKDHAGEFRWQLRAGDGHPIIAHSAEGYRSAEDCRRAIELVKASLSSAIEVRA